MTQHSDCDSPNVIIVQSWTVQMVKQSNCVSLNVFTVQICIVQLGTVQTVVDHFWSHEGISNLKTKYIHLPLVNTPCAVGVYF